MVDSLALLNDIIKSGHSLVYIDTDCAQLITASLQAVNHRHQLDTYLWRNQQGISRTNLAGIFAPGSKSLGNALMHVAQRQNFGIYLFEHVDNELNELPLDWLKLIANDRSEHRRIVLLQGQNLKLHPELEKLVHRYEVPAIEAQVG